MVINDGGHSGRAQEAGAYKVWEHMTFLTVHGCGHTIPTYCPQKGFDFFNLWLKGELD
jgi:carboxypeptidase C (cathepsin A)